jgi:predicted nucleotidyltransferase
MKTLTDKLRQRASGILKRHGVIRASIFGSFARNTASRRSDLDLVVDFDDERSLLDLVGLQQELQDALGRNVDVVTFRSLHPRIRKQVLREQVRIL